MGDDFSPGNTAKMGMYIGHDMNEQIDYNKARKKNATGWVEVQITVMAVMAQNTSYKLKKHL